MSHRSCIIGATLACLGLGRARTEVHGIIEDYGGVANGSQLTCRPENVEIMVVWRSSVSDKFQLAICKLDTRVSKIQGKVSSCKVVDYNEKRGGFGGRGRPSKCDERTEENSSVAHANKMLIWNTLG